MLVMAHMRGDQIGIGYYIVVEEKDDIAACLVCAGIARRGQAAVHGMKDPTNAAFVFEFAGDFTYIGIFTVTNNHHFIVGIGLAKK